MLTMLQIMTNKELLQRDESRWARVYRPKSSEGQSQRRLVRALVGRAFRGSAQKLVMHAVTAKNASREELAELHRRLDQFEGEGKYCLPATEIAEQGSPVPLAWVFGNLRGAHGAGG